MSECTDMGPADAVAKTFLMGSFAWLIWEASGHSVVSAGLSSQTVCSASLLKSRGALRWTSQSECSVVSDAKVRRQGYLPCWWIAGSSAACLLGVIYKRSAAQRQDTRSAVRHQEITQGCCRPAYHPSLSTRSTVSSCLFMHTACQTASLHARPAVQSLDALPQHAQQGQHHVVLQYSKHELEAAPCTASAGRPRPGNKPSPAPRAQGLRSQARAGPCC